MRLLIVSPHFPPTNAPDCHRARIILPGLLKRGWKVTVIAASHEQGAHPCDDSLMETIPAGVAIKRITAPGWPRKLGVGNLGLRIRERLGKALDKELGATSADIVFFSTTQFAVLPLLKTIRKKWEVPSVVDIQDMWWNDHYERSGEPPPGGWKYHFARQSAARKEGPTLCEAAGLVSVSPSYLETLDSRYPELRRTPRAVIPFGCSGRDLELAGEKRSDSPDFPIRYSGRLGHDMAPAVRAFFGGIKQFESSGGEPARRLSIEFFGTSYAGTNSLPALPGSENLKTAVSVLPDRLPYLEALRKLKAPGINLLLGSTDIQYSPSKIYPVILTNRPVIAIVKSGSILEEILREIGVPAVVAFDSPQAPGQIANALETAIRRPESLCLSRKDWDRFQDQFSAEAVTKRLCDLFDEVLNAPEGGDAP